MTDEETPNQMSESVHDEEGFERVYDEDEALTIRRGDLRALLDLATQSMDFGSGFWDNEQTEVARKVAEVLGVDPDLATPSNFAWQYGCKARGEHKWRKLDPPWRTRMPGDTWDHLTGPIVARWQCPVCSHTSADETPPIGADDRPVGQN